MFAPAAHISVLIRDGGPKKPSILAIPKSLVRDGMFIETLLHSWDVFFSGRSKVYFSGSWNGRWTKYFELRCKLNDFSYTNSANKLYSGFWLDMHRYVWTHESYISAKTASQKKFCCKKNRKEAFCNWRAPMSFFSFAARWKTGREEKYSRIIVFSQTNFRL